MTAARNEVRNWRADALCVQVDPDLFFPETDRGTAFDRQVTAAKRVCAGCPVRTQCLDYALRVLPEGIAGGTTPAERNALRRQRGLELVDTRLGLLPPDGQRERAAAGRRAAAAGMRRRSEPGGNGADLLASPRGHNQGGRADRGVRDPVRPHPQRARTRPPLAPSDLRDPPLKVPRRPDPRTAPRPGRYAFAGRGGRRARRGGAVRAGRTE